MSSSDNNTWTVMGIIFIVLTLGLGVGEYFTAKALQKARADSKSALDSYNGTLSKNQTLREQDGRLKEILGYSPDMKFDDLTKDLQTRLTGLGGSDYASCDEAIHGLISAISERNGEIQQANADRDQHYAVAGEEEERSKAQKVEFDTDIDKITADNKTKMVDAAKQYDTLSGETVDQVQEVEKAKQAAAVNRKHLKAQTAEAEKSVKAIADINATLRSKIEQLTDPFFEEPDGEVVYVDQLDRVVRLNIGKKQGVRLLTKFAVFDNDSLQRGEIKPKGAVEVIRFVDDDQVDARIIEDEATLKSVIRSIDKDGAAARVLDAELTDPISRGDLVYTPLWQKGERMTYALDFFLDVDNDGTDDLDLLVNVINASGGTVSAWIDKNGELRGNITPETTYLVVSNTPLDEALDISDLSDQARESVKASRARLFEQAELDGLRQMKLNEFVRRSHFRQTSEITRYQEPGGLDAEPDTTRVPVIPNMDGPSIYNLDPSGAKIDPESNVSHAAISAETASEDGTPVFRRRTPKDP